MQTVDSTSVRPATSQRNADAAFLRIVFADIAAETTCDCGKPLRTEVDVTDVSAAAESEQGIPVIAATRCARRLRSHTWQAMARLDDGPGVSVSRFSRLAA